MAPENELPSDEAKAPAPSALPRRPRVPTWRVRGAGATRLAEHVGELLRPGLLDIQGQGIKASTSRSIQAYSLLGKEFGDGLCPWLPGTS